MRAGEEKDSEKNGEKTVGGSGEPGNRRNGGKMNRSAGDSANRFDND
jgi:hypothetical protein